MKLFFCCCAGRFRVPPPLPGRGCWVLRPRTGLRPDAGGGGGRRSSRGEALHHGQGAEGQRPPVLTRLRGDVPDGKLAISSPFSFSFSFFFFLRGENQQLMYFYKWLNG